jgi:hypothetical protein
MFFTPLGKQGNDLWRGQVAWDDRRRKNRTAREKSTLRQIEVCDRACKATEQ